MPTYNISDLEAKYGDFHSPEGDVVIEGESARMAEMAIGWIEVDLSTESKADIAKFSIMNAYEWSTSTLSWVNSKIAPGKKLVVKLGYADKKSQVFDGLITGYAVEYPSTGSPVVTVTAMDRSFLMMKTSGSKVWKEMKDSDVVRTIASDHGLTPDIDTLTVQKTTIEQIGISDFHFVQSLAQDNDYRFHVTGSKLHFRKHQTSGTPVADLKYGISLRDFTFAVDASGQASQVKVRGFDTKTKQAVEGTASSVTAISGSKSGPSLAAALTAKKIETVYTGVESVDEANHLAKAMLNRMARDLVKGQGTCVGFPELLPGELIAISGLGSAIDRNLMLTRVIHRLDASDGYLVQFEAEGNAL
ncbi:contractile injection system protein, VgrG/Pvc8 family [Paenibacillus sp. LHD-117]|uniref:phage late control D family protein n=1 Tax=Paenibacillus sp. LHD-117 TaxID=3071412 RepID=UPI0027E1B86C|nr:contractile injection system protein, VgrG/Pvc8 family [Paenibacillus sp. LHD-117]MDQ6423035.1 contractile injection system protein, VgrG/Pvc8 family [Paenibacillus sp. LHD-117]